MCRIQQNPLHDLRGDGKECTRKTSRINPSQSPLNPVAWPEKRILNFGPRHAHCYVMSSTATEQLATTIEEPLARLVSSAKRLPGH